MGALLSLGAPGLIYFVMAVLLYFVSVAVYALRWKLILGAMGKDVPLKDLIKVMLSSIFINNVTPFSRSGGEILRIAWISKKFHVPAALTTASVVYERLVEAFPVLILLFLGMFYLIRYPIFLGSLILIALVIAWIRWEDIVEFIARRGKTKISKREIQTIASLRKKISLNLAVFALSSIVWAMDVLRLKLITMAVGLNVSLEFLVVVSVANFLFGIVAFTPGGIGIVEGGLIGTLILFGIPYTLAIAITLLERLISYVISSLVGFLTLLATGGMEIWKALRSH